MINLKIDGIEVSVEKGTTQMKKLSSILVPTTRLLITLIYLYSMSIRKSSLQWIVKSIVKE